jgi:hypothetical protein
MTAPLSVLGSAGLYPLTASYAARMDASGGFTAVPAHVVHCSIMWPAHAHVQSPRLSLGMIGQVLTFFEKSSDAGDGATAVVGMYLASISGAHRIAQARCPT